MWSPPEDVERVLALQAANRLDYFATARAIRVSEISEAMGAQGLARGSDRMGAIVDAASQLWRDTASGITSDHLAVANDISAGVEELDGLQDRVLRLFSEAQHRTVGWIGDLLKDDAFFWQSLVDRLVKTFSETRRDVEIAFGREKLRRRAAGSRHHVSGVSQVNVRDFFLSHAGEDKAEIARPLADELRGRGHSVWFDEYELIVGDSLRQKIDRGLTESRFGIVLLSPTFFEKPWPTYELDSLVARSIVENRKVILPVWHAVTRETIASRSPKLADLLGVNSADGIPRVASELIKALNAAR